MDGLPTSCSHQINAPKQISGSFQEYLTAPVDALVLLPDHLLQRAPDPAALCGALCSGAAALMAVRAARLNAQSVVVVVGTGGAIGNYAATIAKNVFGAKVIGVDIESKIATLKAQDHQAYADVLLAAPADHADVETRAIFHHSLVESCTLVRSNKSTQRAADAVIVAASTAAAFRQLERYVCDGGFIVCSG
jgi:propanol-preferring alcohol dehydrogenase